MNCKSTVTEKLFYQKYSYRITLCLEENNPRITDYLKKHKYEHKIVRPWGSKFLKRYYLKDKAAVRWIQKSCQDVREICAPISTKHIETLKNNSKIRVKNTFFFNHYNVAVHFTHNTLTANDKHWIDMYLYNLSQKCKLDWKWLITYNPTLYLNNIDALTMLKLTYAEAIKEITIIKLPADF